MQYKRGITGIKIAVLIAIAGLLCMPVHLSADVTFTSLEPMKHGLKLPEDVAIAPDGKTYAVDGSQGLIMVYNNNGMPTGNIWISKPTSVAVDANGLIYVGTNENLSVKILDPSYNVVGSLGGGAGEFSLPRNIAIDQATGNVYVVDQIDQSIKIYASNGTFVKKITDYPNLPQDVTIMNNKIYVIDHPLITDQWGGKIRGAKVRVFDMAGNVLDEETFGTYGDQEGQFVRPAGITSDDGILYVSDSFHGVVMCFDADGNYLGAIQNPSNPMVTPMGIALGEDRRLLVASLNTASIHVFGLEGYTEPEGIDVSPSSLAFTAEEGQSNPPEQILTISNTGSETKTYTVAATQEWIVLNMTSVTIDPGSTGTVPVAVEAAGLSIGSYSDQVTITDGTGAMANIPVTLEVTMPAAQTTLDVSPESLYFTYKVGSINPLPQTITIELDGTATWTAIADAGWLSIAPSTGQGGSTTFATVSVDPAGLEAGDHTGTLTVSAPDAVGSPATVAVTLSVLYGGAIQVTCNIEEASFSIEGPEGAEYEGSGETWNKSEVPDGMYTITYNQVIGYRTPPSETKELSGGETITFEGTYESLAMEADIIVSCGADYRDVSTVGIFDKQGAMAFSFTPFAEARYDGNIYRRGVNTAVGDVNGDGSDDIVVGLGALRMNDVDIAVYKEDGTLLDGIKFSAASTKSKLRYGANVAAADFNGDGKAEIVVGAGLHEKNPAHVMVFVYGSGVMNDTGILLEAFEVEGGVNVAAGDVDGDGIPEIITAAGANRSAEARVRVWKVNTSGTPWTVTNTGVNFVAFPGSFGAYVTTGDLNGDGTDEIIASSGPDPQGGLNIIKAFNGDGTAFGLEIYDNSAGNGLTIASADVDNDGMAEIVTGLGTSRYNSPTVKIYKADGTLYNVFNAFEGACYGAIVSVGDLGY